MIGALEVGGTHVSAGLVDPTTWSVSGEVLRMALDAHADTGQLLGVFAEAARQVSAPLGAVWGVGMPDPFDYPDGVGRFHSVDKFEALNGVDVGAGLFGRIRPTPRAISFVNDAEAFLLGEWVRHGAPLGENWAALTLGTGVGSGSLVDGKLITSGYDVPPGGRVHQLLVDGQPLETVMSRRALMRAYVEAGGDPLDVREIAALARSGDGRAETVLTSALARLGSTVAPWLAHFDTVVLGGSMTRSWDVLGPPFGAALSAGGASVRFIVTDDVEASALIGAAWHAVHPR